MQCLPTLANPAFGTFSWPSVVCMPASAWLEVLALADGMMCVPNHSLQPTPVGRLSSALAVDTTGPAWLSSGCLGIVRAP